VRWATLRRLLAEHWASVRRSPALLALLLLRPAGSTGEAASSISPRHTPAPMRPIGRLTSAQAEASAWPPSNMPQHCSLLAASGNPESECFNQQQLFQLCGRVFFWNTGKALRDSSMQPAGSSAELKTSLSGNKAETLCHDEQVNMDFIQPRLRNLADWVRPLPWRSICNASTAEQYAREAVRTGAERYHPRRSASCS